ncbi:MAG TPA: hypothetical protein PLG43_09395 [Spirochaetia bacterium]|jgi:hypothetical protein|nr:hypothetical protein [Spirochaetia bacterium]
MRKRGCFVLSFLLFLGVGAFCQEFDRIVDFEKTLKELSIEAAERPVGKVPPGKYLILEGLVSERWVIDPEPQTFIGEIELVGGEWIGVEAVEMWNCIVQFTGPEFASRIPAGRTRKAAPDEIAINSQVLIAGRLVEIRNVNGKNVPVVAATHIRAIR